MNLEFPIDSHSGLHLVARLFEPRKLTQAREFNGLTKAELAELVEKTPSAITQFESGKIKPDAPTIGQMALVLGMPVSFFSKKPKTQVMVQEDCHFRSLRAASQKERKKIIALGSLQSEILSYCEEHIDLPLEQVSHLSKNIQSVDDIESLATEVRACWGLGLGPIPNLIQLLESKGVVATIVPDSCHNVDAFSTWVENRPTMFLVNNGSSSRLRFDAGHELCHLIAHSDVSPGDQELERQANRFSSAFLLPKDTFYKECPKYLNWNLIFELKQKWRVSAAAIIRRAYDLEQLSESSYRRAQIYINKHYRPTEPFEPAMEKPQIIKRSIELCSEDIPMHEILNEFGLNQTQFDQICNIDL